MSQRHSTPSVVLGCSAMHHVYIVKTQWVSECADEEHCDRLVAGIVSLYVWDGFRWVSSFHQIYSGNAMRESSMDPIPINSQDRIVNKWPERS